MAINDSNWQFLQNATGLSLPFNQMYFKYLRSLGYTGTLQQMIAASGLGLNPSGLENPANAGVGAGPAFQAQFDDYRFSTNNIQKALIEVATVESSAGYALDLSDHYVLFPANVPRVTDRGWFGEDAATNLLTQSATPTNVAWTMTSAGAVIGQNDPARGASAHLVTEVGTSGVLRRTSTVAVVAATGYIIGMVLKRGNTDWVRFGVARETGLTNQSRAWFNLATGAVGTRNDAGTGCGGTAAGIIDLADGWFYCYVAFTAPVVTAVPFIMTATADASTTRTNNGTYSLWNSQLELGAVPTSPIVTTTAAVTRIADVRKVKLGASALDATITYDDDTTAAITAQSGDYTLANGAKYIASVISDDRDAKTWASPKFLVEGLDNTGGMLAMLRYLKTNAYTIPAGTYEHAQDVSLYEVSLPDITLTGTGVEFVATHAAHAGAMFEIGTPNRTGGRVVINGGEDADNPGITWRLNRAGTRTADADHVRLRGMLSYDVHGIAIPSADNNGLMIGREQGGVTDYLPEYVYVDHCHLGGRTADGTHSHGTIGDTAIAVWTPGLITRIEDNDIEMTGDDAIYVGHNSSATVCDIKIRRNNCQWVSGGIGTSYHDVEITDNVINGTLNCAARGEVDTITPTIIAHRCTIARNTITRVGFFTAADAGASNVISQVVPYALWLRGNDSASADNVVDITLQTAFRLEAPVGATLDNLTSTDDAFSRIGCSDRDGTLAATSTGKAVFRRADSANSITDFTVTGCTIDQTNQPIFHGQPQSVDTNLVINSAVSAITLGAMAAISVAATVAGRSFITANIDITDASTIGTPKSVSGGASDPADVTVNIT